MRTPRSAPPASIDVDAPLGDGPALERPLGSDDFAPEPAPLPAPTTDAGWWSLAVLWRSRWWIVLAGILAAALAVMLSLQMPNWYHSETRVLLPEGGGSSLAGLVETVAPGASALIGGGSGDYTRYRAILSSRTVMQRVVERFDLVDVYETATKKDPMGEALRLLGKNVEFEVSLEYDYLAIHVFDQDPQRAAQLANYFVDELNAENIRLTSGSAAENRRFLEVRLTEAQVALDSAQAALQSFQERNGIVEIESQATALVASLGTAQAQVAEAEIQYQALLSELGPDNPQVQAAAAAVAAARGQVSALTGGGEAVMPVPMQRLPQLGRQYAQIQQALITQTEIIRAIQPLYEQARLTERRDANAVQVVDEAVPAVLKARPRRSVIVIVATLSAMLLAACLALAVALLRAKLPVVAARLRSAA